MTVKFFPNDRGNPPGKLADAELHFEAISPELVARIHAKLAGSPLAREWTVLEAAANQLSGLKLVGFAVWERKNGGRNVTFPARQYSVNGERRSYALLRPIVDMASQDTLRDLVLDAYRAHETEIAQAT